MSKSPIERGLTLAETDQVNFERGMRVALMVAIASSFALSFTALAWVGSELMHLPRVNAYFGMHLIVPVCVDVMIAAAAGAIAARNRKGQSARKERTVLFAAILLSIIGNVTHVLALSEPGIGQWVGAAFATAFPLFVAAGVNMHERAIEKNTLREKMLADDPDTLHFDLQTVEESAQGQSRTRRTATRKTTQTRTAPPVPVQTVHAPSAQETVAAARTEPAPARTDQDQPATKEEAIEQINAVVADHMDATGDTPRGLGTELHATLGMGRFIRSESQTRRYVQAAKAAWESERTTDPLTDAHTEPLRASA